MQTKLHINLSQGIVDVEGNVDLVREVYSDFRDQLLSNQVQTGEVSDSQEAIDKPKKTPSKKRAASKKTNKADTKDDRINPDNPKLDKNLDLSNLPAFFEQFGPKNYPEKILIFAKFLVNELKIQHPNTDQFYSCFKKLKEKLPKAYIQAFRDTHGKDYGYIEYKSATDISITTIGTNHFDSGIKRKGSE